MENRIYVFALVSLVFVVLISGCTATESIFGKTQKSDTGAKCSEMAIGGRMLGFEYTPEETYELGCMRFCGDRDQDYVDYICEKDILHCICRVD